MATCTICCNAYTPTVRRQIDCAHCGFGTCLSCVKQYMLTTPRMPHCMSCKNDWTVEYINSIVEKTWLNGPYKVHRQDVLWERQRSMMPATQPAVQKKIAVQTMKVQMEKLAKERDALVAKVYDMSLNIKVMESELKHGIVSMRDTSIKFVRGCTVADCKGFVNSDWKCGVCKTEICAACHLPLADGGEHTCKQEDIDTATALMKTTKPCPSCAALIFKSEGCDQMFCTQCHTAFSWRTGQIETQRIHNPHYYEWVRSINNGMVPREPGDDPCENQNQLTDIWQVNDYLIRAKATAKEYAIIDFYRLLRHLELVELQKLRVLPPHDENFHLQLRIKYMMNQITEHSMKEKLQAREKQNLRKKQMYDIVDMIYNTGKDIMNDLVTKKARNDVICKRLVWIDSLCKYYNENMAAISKRYECVVPSITKTNTSAYDVYNRYY